VEETTCTTNESTVLMIDIAASMILREDRITQQSELQMALAELITRYPKIPFRYYCLK
jgi:uncharacterized protein with von Willebrand factor type A (vWA) domain